VVVCLIGVVRLWLHAETSTVGTAVNITWVGYDLLVISVIYRAALYRAPEPATEAAS
jgi:cellulose synthase (UDP-forming)